LRHHREGAAGAAGAAASDIPTLLADLPWG
jgi:hypothetical protein